MVLVSGSLTVTQTWGHSSPCILFAFSWLMVAGVSNKLPTSFKSAHEFILHAGLSPPKFMLENWLFSFNSHTNKNKNQTKPNQTESSPCFKYAFEFVCFLQIFELSVLLVESVMSVTSPFPSSGQPSFGVKIDMRIGKRRKFWKEKSLTASKYKCIDVYEGLTCSVLFSTIIVRHVHHLWGPAPFCIYSQQEYI